MQSDLGIHVYQDHGFSITDACEVDDLLRCIRGKLWQIHLGLQRPSSALLEDGKQKRSDSSSGKGLAANISVSRCTKVEFVNQWTLEGLSQLWSNKTPCKNYQNHSSNTLETCFSTLGFLRQNQVDNPHLRVLM